MFLYYLQNREPHFEICSCCWFVKYLYWSVELEMIYWSLLGLRGSFARKANLQSVWNKNKPEVSQVLKCPTMFYEAPLFVQTVEPMLYGQRTRLLSAPMERTKNKKHVYLFLFVSVDFAWTIETIRCFFYIFKQVLSLFVVWWNLYFNKLLCSQTVAWKDSLH